MNLKVTQSDQIPNDRTFAKDKGFPKRYHTGTLT